MTEFVNQNQVYLPFQRGKWKGSTAETSEQQIRTHIIQDLGNHQMEVFTPRTLQAFLEEKASTSSFSLVDHLRWDLSSIFEMAVAERVILANPATRLYTPSTAKKGACPTMSATDVEMALNAVELREKVILHSPSFRDCVPARFLPFSVAMLRQTEARSGSNGAFIGASLMLRRMVRLALARFRRGQPPCWLSGWRLRLIPSRRPGSSHRKTERHHSGGTIYSAVTFDLL